MYIFKVIRIFLLNILITFLTSDIKYSYSSEFMPGKLGDSLLYSSSFDNNVKIVIDKQKGNWLHYTDFAGLGPLWIKPQTDNEKVYIRSENGNKQLLVDFDEPVNSEFMINIEPCNIGSVEIASKNGALETPAGSFNDVIRLDFQPSCADAGLLKAWFARNTGLIKYEESNISGSHTFEIVEASINNEELPRGLIIRSSFPDPMVIIDLQPPVDPDRPPVTVKVGIAITNNTERDLVYTFNSGQHFEILLINGNGEVVSRWSRGMAFTQAIETRILRQGEIWEFGGNIELSTDEGESAPEGGYTLRIEMTSSPDDDTDHKTGSEKISAESPLTIIHAQ